MPSSWARTARRSAPRRSTKPTSVIIDRFDELMLKTRTRHPDCLRIWKRLYKHCDELFTFLDDPQVPADNNGTERGHPQPGGGTAMTAARTGPTGVPRLLPGIKSVIVTGMKNHVRFIQYGIEVVRAKQQGDRLPLPLAAAMDTS